jgi:hypothetical protein
LQSSTVTVIEEPKDHSARSIATALNERGIETPAGGKWHAATVIRVMRRFDGANNSE